MLNSKIKVVSLFSILFVIMAVGVLADSPYQDCSVYGNCIIPTPGTNLISGANYSINVNNSYFLNGHPDTYFCINSTMINYVPYSGADDNIDLNSNDYISIGDIYTRYVNNVDFRNITITSTSTENQIVWEIII